MMRTSRIALPIIAWLPLMIVAFHPSCLPSNGRHPTFKTVMCRALLYKDLRKNLNEENELKVKGPSQEIINDSYIENPYYLDGKKPNSAFVLAIENFGKQGTAMLEQFLAEKMGIKGMYYVPPAERPPDCLGLTLDSEAVKEAEEKREKRSGGKIESNPAAKALYDVGCFALDELFDGRPIARFWFLETVARIPYFSYVSMLHMYESFGWWRGNELRKVHNAEEDNELHHLLIMEALGGNALWTDRFLGYHAAIIYYWALNALFLFSPKAAYGFMALLEAHAVDTYSTFLKENKERLKSLPPPAVAVHYYLSADLYLFDDFQVTRDVGTRRPPCDNLYDVFKNICEDEVEHVKTMIACQDYSRWSTDAIVSPHLRGIERRDIDQKRESWKIWAEGINVDGALDEVDVKRELRP